MEESARVNIVKKVYPVTSTKQDIKAYTLKHRGQERNTINSIALDHKSVPLMKLGRNRYLDTVIGIEHDCTKQNVLSPGRLVDVTPNKNEEPSQINSRAENPIFTNTPHLLRIIKDDIHEKTYIDGVADSTKENRLTEGRLIGLCHDDYSTEVYSRAENPVKTVTPELLRITKQDDCELTYLDVLPQGIVDITDPRRTQVIAGRQIIVDTSIDNNCAINYNINQRWWSSQVVFDFEPAGFDSKNMVYFAADGLYTDDTGKIMDLQHNIKWQDQDHNWHDWFNSNDNPGFFEGVITTINYVTAHFSMVKHAPPEDFLNISWEFGRNDPDFKLMESHVFSSSDLFGLPKTIIQPGRQIIVNPSTEGQNSVYTVHQRWYVTPVIADYEPVVADLSGNPIDTKKALWVDLQGLFTNDDGSQFILRSDIWYQTADEQWHKWINSIDNANNFFRTGQDNEYFSHAFYLDTQKGVVPPDNWIRITWQVNRPNPDGSYGLIVYSKVWSHDELTYFKRITTLEEELKQLRSELQLLKELKS